MSLPGIVPPSDLLASDARIPGFAVRVAFAIVGTLVCLADYRLTGWLVLGVSLSLAAAFSPRSLLGWVLILFLGAGQLSRHVGLGWRFLILLAGLHLLYVLAMLALEVPWNGWVQRAVFTAPLTRFVVIQIPTQIVAVAALLLLAPSGHGHRPLTLVWFGVVGALAVAGLALLLLGSQLDEDGTRRL